MNINNHLIIGYGEVGSSLVKVLKKNSNNNIFIVDKIKNIDELEKLNTQQNPKCYLHICIPFIKDFESEVTNYILQCNSYLTIIHSTVAPGTTKNIYNHVEKAIVHSPILGIHPNLDKGIETFPKWIGPVNDTSKYKAIEVFKQNNLNPKCMNSSEETEMAKIMSTTYYGVNIAFANKLKRLCDKHNLNFENVYTEWNKEYNKGYKKLGKENVIRPILKVDKAYENIGGHCITGNCEILHSNEIEDEISEFVLEENYSIDILKSTYEKITKLMQIEEEEQAAEVYRRIGQLKIIT